MFKDILLYTNYLDDAVREVRSIGGYVTQKLTQTIFVTLLPDYYDPEALGRSTPDRPEKLDPISNLVADGWEKVFLQKAMEEEEEEPIKWSDPGYQAPGKDDSEDKQFGYDYSAYLKGSVAMGLVVVSGPDSDLQFSDGNKVRVLGEVMEGLQFLAREAPLFDVVFDFDINFININAAKDSTCNSGTKYEPCEKIWRDPALNKMGYTSTTDYISTLKNLKSTKFAYAAYFTKYPQETFAYANDNRLCMQYDNDGWGPAKINRVFAHETGHVFGAADEYNGTIKCKCDAKGYYEVQNYNCVNCTPKQVNCLMDENSLSLCFWSRGQLGWIPKIEKGLGSITIDKEFSYTFIADTEKKLWNLSWDGKKWFWEKLQTPGNVGVDMALGSIVTKTGKPYVFFKGSDGNVWNLHKFDGRWSWENLKTPTGVSIEEAMGSLAYLDERPYVFVKGSDGNLWNLWDYHGKWNWTNMKTPSGVSIEKQMGCVVDNAGQVFIFIFGSDNNLWVRFWDLDKWSWNGMELPPNISVKESIGSVVIYGNRPYNFFIGSDGNIWNHYFKDGKYLWANQKTPSGVAVDKSMGITVADSVPNVFIKGNDLNLWRLYYHDAKWIWQNMESPSSGVLEESMGAITINDNNPYVFVSSYDAKLKNRLWCGIYDIGLIWIDLF